MNTLSDTHSLATAEIKGPPIVAWQLLDGAGTILSERKAQVRMYAASTIKLHILLAVLRAVDAGVIDPHETLAASRTAIGVDGQPFTLVGDHLDEQFPAEGEPITVLEAARLMITRSSNEATNMCVSWVGFAAIQHEIQQLTGGETRVERMIGDQVAIERGLTNETSAQDLAVTMHALATNAVGLSPESHEFALAALRAQETRVITSELASCVAQTDFGSKSGEVPGIRHDVAFIGTAQSSQFRVLAVLTSGFESEAAGTEAVCSVTAALLGGS